MMSKILEWIVSVIFKPLKWIINVFLQLKTTFFTNSDLKTQQPKIQINMQHSKNAKVIVTDTLIANEDSKNKKGREYLSE